MIHFNDNLIANALEGTDYCPAVLIKMSMMSTSGHSSQTVAGLSASYLKLFLQKDPVFHFRHASTV